MKLELLSQQGQAVQLRGTLSHDEVQQALAAWCRVHHSVGGLDRWHFSQDGRAIVDWSETWPGCPLPGRHCSPPEEPEPATAGYIAEEWRTGI